jgi:hypothetical protein
MMVTAIAISLHVHRLGIDSNRLGDVSGWHPPTGDGEELKGSSERERGDAGQR